MSMSRVIRRYNFEFQYEAFEEDLLRDLHQAFSEGRYVLTKEVDRFEQDFAHYVGAKYAVGVNSGTDALTLAFSALSISDGDEVITVANTFHATVLAILRAGARPVLVDCDPHTYLLDPERIEHAITPRTKAITVVHLFGKAVDMAPINDIASRHRLPIVEDAAQAVGAKWKGSQVGSIGKLGCFSFHPSKNLAAAGDGGAVTTSDPALNERLRQLRHMGQKTQNEHIVVGYNTKLDTIQAIVLGYKLSHLDEWNRLRIKRAREYRQRLSHLPLTFQAPGEEGGHVYHLFQIRTPVRDLLHEHLVTQGIDAVVRYPVAVHLQPAFKFLGYTRGDFPNSEALARETICLPIRPDLTDKEMGYVCKAVARLYDQRS